MLKSKVMTIILIILALFIVLILTGKKSVHHEIIINANPQKVWKVLTETEKYDEWNPVMKLLEGEIKEGNKVKYQFTQDSENISEIPSKVKEIVPNQLLNQGGGLPLVITFDHKYILEPIQNGTRLIIHEDYRGVWVNFWNPAPVEAAYVNLNKAIKQRVESLKF